MQKFKLPMWKQIQATYVHIPFCIKKCFYCDFISYVGYKNNFMKQYTDTVIKEIILKKDEKLPVSDKATIYFGGGTPSVLPVDCIEKIVNTLKDCGFWRNPQEATIEVNPGTVDMDKLYKLRKLGFDRISFGIQSLNDVELKAIGRIHTAKDALLSIEMAKEAGFNKINADIIYGLPKQTLESLYTTLEKITQMDIEHLSVYGLIVEQDTQLSEMINNRKISLPDDELCADMYEFVQKFLYRQGFERYEISNYAKNYAYSIHNLVYWQYLPYIAFGSAACSFDGSSRRFTGNYDVEKYVTDGKNNIFTYTEEILTEEEQLSEFMFMNLRKCNGVDLNIVKERFNRDIMSEFKNQLKPFFDKKLIVYDGNTSHLRLTEAGMEIGNQIFEIFVTV